MVISLRTSRMAVKVLTCDGMRAIRSLNPKISMKATIRSLGRCSGRLECVAFTKANSTTENGRQHSHQVRLTPPLSCKPPQRGCPTAAGLVPRLTKGSEGARCTRHDAVQFEPPEAARPPGQRTGGLTARVK